METRLLAAIDAIVATLKAEGVTTWDGPMVSGDYSDAVYIGYDADPDGNRTPAGSSQQAWAGMGQRKRNEDIQITGAAIALVGDGATPWKTARDAAYGMIETVGQVLRGNASIGPSLGLSPPAVAELWPGDLFQEATPKGYQARVVFTIRFTTRV